MSGWIAPSLALLTLAACVAGSEPDAGYTRGTVTIRGEPIEVLLAESFEQKALGLGGREGLPEGLGMLFVYPAAGPHAFWMKGMRFDIDIVWIDRNHVVDIAARVPHAVSPPLPTYRPRVPADRVLEVTAGTAEARGWRIGDSVRIDLPAPPPQ